MTLHSIIDQFDVLMGAPDSVPRLRQFILQLAVQGKLTERDPSDEPAEQLLERIQAEKQRLYDAGKIRKPKNIPPVSEEEIPFSLPQSWCWTRLGTATNYGRSDKIDPEDISDDTWVVSLGDVEKDTSKVVERATFAERKSKSTKNVFEEGDVLYGKLRPALNKVILADTPGVCTTEMLPLRGYVGIYPKYLLYALKRPNFLEYASKSTAGMSMPRLRMKDGRRALFPMPPYAEQQRIVTTVERLMDECDTLEARQDAAEQVRVRCTEAATHALQTADTPAAVRTAWHRLRDHFATLTATPHDVDAVRQTILQLAVQGKLTEQDPGDEPADQLLKRMEAGKEEMKAAGDHKYQKDMPPITEADIPFSFPRPTGWIWARLGSLGKIYGGGTPKKSNSEYWGGEMPWVSPKDMDVDVVNDTQDKISDLGVAESSAKLVPPGSVLIVGRSGILQRKLPVAINAVECTVNQDIKVLTPYVAGTERYIQLMLRGFQPFILDQLVKTGTTVESLKYTEFQLHPYPFPPLAEQQRIVATVDRLMDACDTLEAQLNRQQALGAELLDAVLHEAAHGEEQTVTEEVVTAG